MITLVRFRRPVVIDGVPTSIIHESHIGDRKILWLKKDNECLSINTAKRCLCVPLENVESWEET
jgi:hypothetical protein